MNHIQPKKYTLFVIVGPTAVGKTAVGIHLAHQFDCAVISADSRQFYREMKIGTAVPTTSEMEMVKHYFIGNKSITEDYNVSLYESEVLNLLPELFTNHDNLVVVGGSGLYISAICNGIDDMPVADPVIRNQLNKLFSKEGISSFQEKLRELDPEYYQEVDLKNPVRLQRAIEVCLQTGKPYSFFRKNVKKERDFNIVKIGIEREKPELIERIDQRVDQMIEEGLLEEVRSLLPYRHFNALNTVGYKELFTYLDGNISQEQAIAAIKINTRHYAKRQLTWFKKDTEIHWFHPDQIINLIENKGKIGQ